MKNRVSKKTVLSHRRQNICSLQSTYFVVLHLLSFYLYLIEFTAREWYRRMCTGIASNLALSRCHECCFTQWINGYTIGMGRRKLQFDQRKNYERKKYRNALCVQIPLEVLKPSQLLVKLPISAYTLAAVPDPAVLRSRLVKSNLVPSL